MHMGITLGEPGQKYPQSELATIQICDVCHFFESLSLWYRTRFNPGKFFLFGSGGAIFSAFCG
jgi:hypothetical protein